ncbi:MAG: hypothetical protein ACRDZM_09175 [Acidimicrobiia bacterium]
MRQPEPNRDSQAFLSALADELFSPPDELTAGRHVMASASAARSASRAARSHAIRWVAAAVAVTTVFGTGGIAAAGGLPGPLQTVVADAARSLPVPVRIPYPDVAALDTAAPGSTHADRAPGDGEINVEPIQLGQAETAAEAKAPAPVEQAEMGSHPDVERDRDHHEDHDRSCEPGDLGETGQGQIEGEELVELREEIHHRCDPGFVDPPGFLRGSSDDPRRGEAEDRERGRDHDDRETGDRHEEEWQGDEGDDADFGSSDGEQADESSDNESDEQEERHDDEDDGQDRSSTDAWPDRHD